MRTPSPRLHRTWSAATGPACAGGNAGDQDCERALQFFCPTTMSTSWTTCAIREWQALENLCIRWPSRQTSRCASCAFWKVSASRNIFAWFMAATASKPNRIRWRQYDLREFAASPTKPSSSAIPGMQTARNAGTLAPPNYAGAHDRAAYPAVLTSDRLTDLPLSSEASRNEKHLHLPPTLSRSPGRPSACSWTLP